ncbi:Uncharacterised protein [Klebsiella pneumoniae]|nr:Uncharacterised protein [Klebsiella pneumoniae]SLY14221.1 Uncharacterised protein [Klebsiella pneumoniae]
MKHDTQVVDVVLFPVVHADAVPPELGNAVGDDQTLAKAVRLIGLVGRTQRFKQAIHALREIFVPVIQQIEHRWDDRFCFELRHTNELLHLHLVAGSVCFDGLLLALDELLTPLVAAGSWHDQQNVCHIRDLLPVLGPDILFHPFQVDFVQPGSVKACALVIRPVVESQQAVNHVVAFVAINEVVNLMHECDLFLALGHNFVDDVHFLPVVDISVWGDSVNDGKGCIHDHTIKQIVFLLVLFSQS